MKYRIPESVIEKNKNAQNALAMLDLLNEHEKQTISAEFTRADCGRAHISEMRFTIPLHALNRGGYYLEYYVIHEFTHCSGRHYRHDNYFKEKEQQLLALFGMEIKYARAYPKYLYANGEKVYEKKHSKKFTLRRAK